MTDSLRQDIEKQLMEELMEEKSHDYNKKKMKKESDEDAIIDAAEAIAEEIGGFLEKKVVEIMKEMGLNPRDKRTRRSVLADVAQFIRDDEF